MTVLVLADTALLLFRRFIMSESRIGVEPAVARLTLLFYMPSFMLIWEPLADRSPFPIEPSKSPGTPYIDPMLIYRSISELSKAMR